MFKFFAALTAVQAFILIAIFVLSTKGPWVYTVKFPSGSLIEAHSGIGGFDVIYQTATQARAIEQWIKNPVEPLPYRPPELSEVIRVEIRI